MQEKKTINSDRNYNIITCLPQQPYEKTISRFPRLGNPKKDQFSENRRLITQKNPSLPISETNIDLKKEDVKNLMNSSSLNYDFISFTHKINPDTIYSLRDKGGIMTNKKKSIAEFADLGRLMCPNFNPNFQETLKDRPTAFRRPKGMCSYLCENAKGYGRKQFRKYKY